MKILITGGAGFVGSYLARTFTKNGHKVTALDNLHRRGSEFNLPRFRELGIEFVHGDIRQPNDLRSLAGNFDLFIEASAEPSVHAGLNQSPSYVLDTNLTGTLNCLEFAKERTGTFIFLSTSRVYSIEPLRQLKLKEENTRFTCEKTIDESFPTHLPRSFYGATKLASELIVQEYAQFLNVPAVINRCGVISGPGQFGKVDQGVFSLWLVRHYFGLPVTYMGFGGTGKQVRDLLHPLDLYALIEEQVKSIDKCRGEVFNVGGGKEVSLSLQELTHLCQGLSGRVVPIHQVSETNAVDVPYYITDYQKCHRTFGWAPQMGKRQIFGDILSWIKANERELRQLYASEIEASSAEATLVPQERVSRSF